MKYLYFSRGKADRIRMPSPTLTIGQRGRSDVLDDIGIETAGLCFVHELRHGL